ncbi:MAG TPA: hypothetical protein VF815_24045 [Myxococcaceae bacterium]|jgi:hypothetical protein
MNNAVCPMRASVDDHFARRLKPGTERTLREHLPRCGSCKSLYDRYLLFRKLDPRAANDSQKRLGQGLGLVRPPLPVAQGVAALAAVVVLSVSVVMTREAPFEPAADMAGFTARGGAKVVAPEALRVFRVRPGVPAEAVEGEVHARDELAFAYQNPNARKWLLIYGVDEHQHVYWFHPSWSNPDEEPAAVKAFGGVALHELPEAISHEFDGKTLVLHGVLADERLTVKQAEALLKGRAPEQPLPLAGAEHTSFTVRVRR